MYQVLLESRVNRDPMVHLVPTVTTELRLLDNHAPNQHARGVLMALPDVPDPMELPEIRVHLGIPVTLASWDMELVWDNLGHQAIRENQAETANREGTELQGLELLPEEDCRVRGDHLEALDLLVQMD